MFVSNSTYRINIQWMLSIDIVSTKSKYEWVNTIKCALFALIALSRKKDTTNCVNEYRGRWKKKSSFKFFNRLLFFTIIAINRIANVSLNCVKFMLVNSLQSSICMRTVLRTLYLWTLTFFYAVLVLSSIHNLYVSCCLQQIVLVHWTQQIYIFSIESKRSNQIHTNNF